MKFYYLLILISLSSQFTRPSSAGSNDHKDSKESNEKKSSSNERLAQIYPQLATFQLEDATKNKSWHLILLGTFINRLKWPKEIKDAYNEYDEKLYELIQEILKAADVKLKLKLLSFEDVQQILQELQKYAQGIEYRQLCEIKGSLIVFKNKILFGKLGEIKLPQMRGNPSFAQAWYDSSTDQERSLAVSYLIAQITPVMKNNQGKELLSLFSRFIDEQSKLLTSYIQERARDLIKQWNP